MTTNPQHTPLHAAQGHQGKIGHIVVILMENHTYTSLLANANLPGDDPNPRWPAAPNPPRSDWPHDHRTWLSHRDRYRLQYGEADVPHLYAFARQGAVATRFFSRYGTNSFAGHSSVLTGMTPIDANPSRGSKVTFPIQPSAQLLDRAGVPWRIYGGWAAAYIGYLSTHTGNLAGNAGSARFLTDARKGALPAVSYVFPPSGHSQHPPEDLRLGDAWYAQVIEAVASSPAWKDAAIFVTYDDWGGLADAIPPPVLPGAAGIWAPDGTVISEGSRLPLVILSPYAQVGLHRDQADHASIPRFISDNWQLAYPNTVPPSASLPAVDWSTVGSLDGAFDFARPPLPPVKTASGQETIRTRT